RKPNRWNQEMLARFICGLVLLSTLPCYARGDDGPPGYKHVKGLESFIGNWTASFDPPGVMPAGTVELEFQWMGNRGYVQHQVWFRPITPPNEKSRRQIRMNPETMIIGFDPKRSETRA
ncbi:MAG: hypothetical protein AAF989_09680, partial [Planctomycetota bacterium]